MKTIVLGLILLGFAGSILAIEPAALDNRVRALTAKFETMQAKPDKSIPPDVLSRARGIILLDRTKAGFLFAYQGGGGVAMVKDANAKPDKWSPVAFLGASEASLGFQIGGEQDFYVILLMSSDANRLLTEPNFTFGGEARGTAGNSSGGQEGKVSTVEQPYLVYSDRKGLYGGATIKGGAVTPDEKANFIYYGQSLTMRDILLNHKVEPTDSATDLAKSIAMYSKIHDDTYSARR
jgi:lipid-binding SYLF domain-containing protein